MSGAPYQRIPTSDPRQSEDTLVEPANPPFDHELHAAQLDFDARYKQPTPPWWQRLLLIIFVIFIHWLAWKLLPVGTKPIQEDEVGGWYFLGGH